MKVSVRLEKTRSFAGQSAHDFRKGRQPSYVDESRSHLNRTLISPPDMAQVIKDTERRSVEENHRKWQKNSPFFIDGIITFDKEYSANRNAISIDEMDKAAKRFVDDWCKDKGVEPLYLVRHSDEATPHYHFKTTVMNVGGKSIARGLNRDAMRETQDLAGEAFKDLGFERGTDKYEKLKAAGGDWKKANVVNRSVRQLHADLPKELQALQAKVEKNQRLHEQATLKLKKAYGEKKAKIEKNISIYKKRAEDARQELERLRMELAPIDAVKSEAFSAKKTMFSKAEEVAPTALMKPLLIQTADTQKRLQAERRSVQEREKLAQAQQDALAREKRELDARKRALDERERTLTRLEIFKGRIFIGEPINSNIEHARRELLHRLNWVDSNSGWTTLKNSKALLKYNTKEMRATVKDGSYQEQAQALALALADMKSSGMTKAVYTGNAEVLAELQKITSQDVSKYPSIDADEASTIAAERLLRREYANSHALSKDDDYSYDFER